MNKLYTLVISILFVLSLPAQDPGDLDMSFGTNGISIQSLLDDAQIYSLSVMDDGKIVGAGNLTTAIDDRMILSYLFNADGTLAPFAGGDWLEFQLGYNYEITRSSCILADGRILLAGIYYDAFPDSYFFVMCLHPDGTLDTSFGTDGIATQAGLDFNLNAISVYYGFGGEFDIFLGGYTSDGGSHPAIIKLDQDGQLINTFGTDGIFELIGMSARISDIYAYSLTGSGYLLAGGHDANGIYIFLSKHDLNTGALITSFGTDGLFTTVPTTGEEPDITSLVFHSTLSENTITAFGDIIHPEGDVDIFALRLNASDGSRDPDFGINGWSSFRVAGSNENLHDAILQGTDGKYYFGGRSNANGDNDFMIGRVLNNGYIDPAFGDNGITLTDIGGSEYLRSLALSPDEDRLYAGGNSNNSTTNHPTVACYYTGVGVGISSSETYQEEMHIYPNPAKELITIETGNDDNYAVEVYDVAGKLLKIENLSGEKLQLNLSEISEGIYILKVISDNQTIKTSKIIIQ